MVRYPPCMGWASWGLCVASIVSFAACGEKTAQNERAGVAEQAVTTTLPSATFSVAVVTPAGVPAVNAALVATNAVSIGSGVHVTSGVSGPGVIANTGAGGVDIEPDAQVMDVHSGSLVALRDRVQVHGTVFAPSFTKGSNVQVTGGI